MFCWSYTNCDICKYFLNHFVTGVEGALFYLFCLYLKGGSYIVHLFDNYTVAPSILIVAFFEAIAVMHIYGKQ